MQFPVTTHQQFLVLSVVEGEPRMSGQRLREELERTFGLKKSLPSFYQLMSRLEAKELLVGEYHTRIHKGRTLKTRHYSVTEAGRRAWNTAFTFYSSLSNHGGTHVVPVTG